MAAYLYTLKIINDILNSQDTKDKFGEITLENFIIKKVFSA